MKILLDDNDVKEIMYDSFCNGGLQEMYHCDCFIDWDNKANSNNYLKAKTLLKKEGKDDVCIEDIYIKMLQDFGIVFKDECMGDDDNNIHLTFAMAKENLQKAIDNDDADKWFLSQVNKVIPEYNDGDAWTYFALLQGALFGDGNVYC
tara:strand:- start:1980 stop:2423 length:444 start_codon:yes stop_codon:yes gene_type:complete